MRTNRLSVRQRLVAALLLAASFIVFMPGAPAQVPSVTQGSGGQGPTGETSTTAAIPASSTTVTLTAPSGYITIVNLSTTTTLYFSAVSPATTSNFAIAPSSAFSYSGVPLSVFYVIGSAASGNYSVLAH
jgi:hypothetical protein